MKEDFERLLRSRNAPDMAITRMKRKHVVAFVQLEDDSEVHKRRVNKCISLQKAVHYIAILTREDK